MSEVGLFSSTVPEVDLFSCAPSLFGPCVQVLVAPFQVVPGLLGASWELPGSPGCSWVLLGVYCTRICMPSCSTRRHVFSLHAGREYMSSCGARRHVFLFNKKTCFLVSKKTCLLVEQEDVYSCRTRGHAFLLDRKTCLLARKGDTSSCPTRGHAFLLEKKTRLIVQQEAISSCGTRRQVSCWTRRQVFFCCCFFFFNKKSCLLVATRIHVFFATTRHVFLLNKKTCLLVHMDTEWVVLKINRLGISRRGHFFSVFVCMLIRNHSARRVWVYTGRLFCCCILWATFFEQKWRAACECSNAATMFAKTSLPMWHGHLR